MPCLACRLLLAAGPSASRSDRLTIRPAEVEQRVLHGAQEKVLRQDLFEEFGEEFTGETKRLRMEDRANLSSAPRASSSAFRAGIRKIIDAIKDSFAGPELRAEMAELQGRRESFAYAARCPRSASAAQNELKGNLAAMLCAAQNAKRSPETGDLSLQVQMVAGAGFEPATFGL